MKIVTAAQMQALDRRTIQEGRVPSLTLMERAGSRTVDEMERAFGDLKGKRIVVLCGKGHNGGDGLVIARLLRKKRADIRVLLVHPPSELAVETRSMYGRLVRQGAKRQITTAVSAEILTKSLTSADLIVDALLGTGLGAPVSGVYQVAIDAMNQSGLPVIAVDLPSGLHADTGAALGTAVRASLTVTFGLPKCGLYLGEGIDHAGVIRIVDIGIPAEYAGAVDSSISLLTAAEMARRLPVRHPSAHKGTFGHAGIIAGSVGKTGAAALATKAALRVGAGLVTVATPAGVNDVLEGKLLEAMTHPVPETAEHTFALSSLEPLLHFAESKTALAIGPGMSTQSETVQMVQRFLQRITLPTVVDADALNAAASLPSLWANCKAPLVLTPHPGEMARLTGLENGQAVNRDRLGAAHRLAQTHGVMVVLKGARTVLADPEGRLAICPTGNAGLATGGTGDVLTGMIAGLLAQGMPAWDAACAGTYLHGLAGDLASVSNGQAGLIAGDVIEHIPHAFEKISS